MKTSGLGEFGLIERIKRHIRTDSCVIKGIGDDAAVIKYRKDKYLLFASDMLVEDVHFTLKDATPFQIGHKALACNISDIAAMGGVPRYITVSIGLPKNLSVGFVDKLYKGILTIARKFNINIVGGDTNSSQKLVIDIAIIGEAEKSSLKTRDGAKVGDAVMVTGSLGGSLKSGRHLNFIPRLKEARWLVKNYRINSMIDISDGLSSDLMHILKESRVGAIIYEEKIPVSSYTSSVKNALTDGEDFELLWTMPEKEAERLIRCPSKGLGVQVTAIGRIVFRRFGAKIINRYGKIQPLKAQGFCHF